MARLKGRWGLALLAALAWTVLAILVARSEGLSLLVTLVAILVPVLLIAMLSRLGNRRDDGGTLHEFQIFQFRVEPLEAGFGQRHLFHSLSPAF